MLSPSQLSQQRRHSLHALNFVLDIHVELAQAVDLVWGGVPVAAAIGFQEGGNQLAEAVGVGLHQALCHFRVVHVSGICLRSKIPVSISTAVQGLPEEKSAKLTSFADSVWHCPGKNVSWTEPPSDYRNHCLALMCAMSGGVAAVLIEYKEAEKEYQASHTQ